MGQLVADGVDLAPLHARHHGAGLRLVLHVIDTGANIDQRLEHRMRRDIVHTLATNIDLAAISDGILILCTRADHDDLLLALA